MQDCDSEQGVAYGIGVQFRVSDGRALVSDIRADGPSSDLGLAVGDELQSVDGQQIDASRFDHVAVLIRGSEGTQVRLTLRRDGETKEVVATRSVPLSTKVSSRRHHVQSCEHEEEVNESRRRLLQSRQPRPLSSLPNNEEYGNTTWRSETKAGKKKPNSISQEDRKNVDDNDGVDILKKKCNYLNRENKILTDELASELSARKQLLKTLQDGDRNPWSNFLGVIGQENAKKGDWAKECTVPHVESIPWYERVFTCGKRFPDFRVKD
mmetsp:Transcript_31583/g.71043  ORF Transcript_31583/g.71043 Transcript_31583/m.71043 type:complete len:267 (-) Transcript_31583:139-939(-)